MSSHPELRCVPCERLFRSHTAVQTHYKDSSAHPVCTLCSVTIGFKDDAAYDQHEASSHPGLRCTLCERLFRSGAAIQDHYKDSSAHPHCTLCSVTVGFRDNAAYDEHIASSHPELRCTPCRQVFHSGAEVQEHYRDSSAHPLCTLCSIGFKDNGAYDEHIASRHPPPPPKPLVVETSSPQMIQTFVEDSTPTPRSVTVDLLSAPFTPRSRQSMNLTLATELPTPLTDVSQFRHSLLGESSHSTSAHRAVSEPTLPSASSLRAGSGAVSQTPTSPAMTERTLEYIRSSALRAGNAISRLSRTPSPAMSRSFSLRGLRHKRPESVSSESLQSLHSSDVDSDTKSPNFDTLSSPENELPGPIHALLTPAEIAARGTKTPEPRQRSDVEKTPTRLPDPPSNSRSVAASETPSRRGEPRVPREHVPMAPTPVRSYSKVSISRLSSVRRSMSAASRLSVHGVSDDTDDTVRENPKLPTDDSARTSTVAKGLSWHCRVCQRDPCVQPTATMCGHIFCNSCIIRELSDNMQCPVCKKTMLLRLHVETD
ncbi:hypothetical protein B0H21DRAFT_286781 [Amylocystis lapponica]|nr:hypothetical protein B0H21DRAFT_286781 [Amylocystis lapponica]